ncbi:MAG: restriction endonuclease subunit S, partial [Lentisphaerae bacterium]|nr:restriction endonuclease subunit S [Lentisphaerota bacterium]
MSAVPTLSIPGTWRRRRLRFDASINPVKSELNREENMEVSFVPMEAVGEFGGLLLDQSKRISEVYNGYTYFTNGDVCIAKITPCFENGKGALADSLLNGVAFGTTELHIIRPYSGVDKKFLFYLTIAHDFRSFGASEMLGAGGQKRVPERFLKDWMPPLPPL